MFSLYELFSIFTAGFSFIILLIKVLHCLCFRSRISINSNPNRNSNVFTINEQNNEVVISDIDSENDKRFEIEGFTNINFDELKVQEIHIDVVNHPQ